LSDITRITSQFSLNDSSASFNYADSNFDVHDCS